MKAIFILLLTLLAATCSVIAQRKEVTGNQKLTSVDREVAPFKHLKVIGMHAILEKKSSRTITIVAESNVIDYVQSYVAGDTLILQPDMSFTLRGIQIPIVKIPFQNLKSIRGSIANIKTISPLESDSLYVQLQINSHFDAHINANFLNMKLITSQAHITGVARKSKMSLITKSIIDARDLKIDDLVIWEETLSKADVDVSKQLSISQLGENEIFNKGKAIPKIETISSEKMSVSKFASGRPDITKFHE